MDKKKFKISRFEVSRRDYIYVYFNLYNMCFRCAQAVVNFQAKIFESGNILNFNTYYIIKYLKKCIYEFSRFGTKDIKYYNL